MTPEQFLADYPPEIQEMADGLRAMVKQAVPDIEEKVYRGWRLIGYRVLPPESCPDVVGPTSVTSRRARKRSSSASNTAS